MTEEQFVYSRIGMALISAQRVEFLTKSLVSFLIEFYDDFQGLTAEDFLDESKQFQKIKKPTLGNIFKQLNKAPKLVLEDDLAKYLEARNFLVHHLWRNYLFNKSAAQVKEAIEFCNNFGKLSDHLEDFFKGFIYFIKLRYTPTDVELDDPNEPWSKEFDYFISSLAKKSIFND